LRAALETPSDGFDPQPRQERKRKQQKAGIGFGNATEAHDRVV
jgi:hypothetical protein